MRANPEKQTANRLKTNVFALSAIFINVISLLYSGPEGTCFEGGVFEAQLVFPPDYPLNPPKMKFKSEMFHPNSEYILTFLVGMGAFD